MPIKPTPGTLYFLTERDFLTHETSSYVKIGLVRNEKETEKRIKEHKTGNPREIIDYCSLEVPFVEYLETMMHYLYADCWITGEWFLMDPTKLDQSIQVAKDLIKEQEQWQPTIETSQSLDAEPSDGTKTPSKEETELFEHYLKVRGQYVELKKKMELNDTQLRNAMSTHQGVNGIVDFIAKEGSPTFDTTTFKKDHEDLYNSYLEDKETWYKRFNPKGLPAPKDVCPQLVEQIKNINFTKPSFEEMKQPPLDRSEELTQLHAEYIALEPQRVRLEWEIEKLEAQLKVAMGSHEFLGDLVQWTRGAKVSPVFNKSKFQAEHPDLYQQYLKDPVSSYSVSVRSWREYRF